MCEIKTSRALSSGDTEAFRIEDKMIDDKLIYDVIWQANGEDDAVAMLVEEEDLEHLRDLINKKLEK